MSQAVPAAGEGKKGGSRLGGACTILVGALYVLLILYVVATSAEARYDAGAF